MQEMQQNMDIDEGLVSSINDYIGDLNNRNSITVTNAEQVVTIVSTTTSTDTKNQRIPSAYSIKEK